MQVFDEVLSRLLDIEVCLRQLNLWQCEPPANQALLSSEPFCIDTLEFPQWLQFVFLPRMHGIIEAHQILPEKCEIGPMSEEYFKLLELKQVRQLISSLYSLDRLLSQPAENWINSHPRH